MTSIWYAGKKWLVNGEAIHVEFDDGGPPGSARTNCPSCDGYGFHRAYCNLVKLNPQLFPESPSVSPVSSGEAKE